MAQTVETPPSAGGDRGGSPTRHRASRYLWAVGARGHARRPAVRLRPGRHLGCAERHRADVRHQHVHARGHHELGDARRDGRRARRRRAGRPPRSAAHDPHRRGASFSVGALVESLAPEAGSSSSAGSSSGFGVGVASVAAPLYAAEMAPARVRGRLVSLYQMAITIGIFIAYCADYLAGSGDSDSWRVMLGVSAIPAVLLVLAIWPHDGLAALVHEGGPPRGGRAALAKVEPEADVDARARRGEAAVDSEPRPVWGEVFARAWRRPLMIGVALACPPTAHRHQRDHLLRRQDLRRRGLRLADEPEPRDAVGDRRRERAGDARSRCATSTGSAASRCC